MSRVIYSNTVHKFNDWLKARLVDPNLYCALTGVLALVIIETVIFAS
ncbi:hypothetical protein GCM10011338_37170 [Alteromonas lipolytica]|nr:hypothetical protein GCM10011338_37170 [Alteromonas lipolytica]